MDGRQTEPQGLLRRGREAIAGKEMAIAIGLVLAVVTYLSLKKLDNTHFWDDEAMVGILARNLATTGRFTGWDGRNLFAYRNASALDESLRPRHPPLDCVLAAASFRLFGVGTWAGRLPFVLIGLAALAVFLLLLRDYFPEESRVRLLALAVLGLSPVFLLNVRQCRYYAPCILFALTSLYGHRLYLRTKKAWALAVTCAAGVLLFYANYLVCVAFMMSLLVVHIAFHRQELSKADWIRIGVAAAVFAALTFPYAVYYRIWERPHIPVADPWYFRRPKLLWWNLGALNSFAILPWTVAVGLGWFLARRGRTDRVTRTVCEIATVVLVNVVVVAAFSPQPTKLTSAADIRYLLAVVPLLAVLTAVSLSLVWERSRAAALSLLAVLLASNLLAWTPFDWKFRWLLPAYVGEVHRDYPTAYGEVARFLERNADHDDLVLAFPDHTNYPIMFYSGKKVRLCCRIDRRCHLPASIIAKLNAPLYLEDSFPDWLVSFGTHGEVLKLIEHFSRPHEEGEATVRWRYDMVEALDVYYQDTNRPEIEWHSFGPVREFDRRKDGVYIFRKSRAAETCAGAPQGTAASRRTAAAVPEASPEELEARLRESSKDPVLHNDLGTALAKAGRADEAVSRWLKAVELRPDYALPHRNLAVYYRNELNDPVRAEEHMREFRRLSGEPPVAPPSTFPPEVPVPPKMQDHLHPGAPR
ncbi:MAG: glycosyltransferase family 39 protein [Planctomycetota bacterium]